MTHPLKHLLTCLIAILFSQMVLAQQCPIIPAPLSAVKAKGTFVLNGKTPIHISGMSLISQVIFLREELTRLKGLVFEDKMASDVPGIKLELKKIGGNAETYTINSSPKGITIAANTEQGIGYGIISLLQLTANGTEQGSLGIDCWNITDSPQYGWRGFMLDESRHFFGKEKVKSLLNWMAYYKLNRFHWHLTDEPAWRIQIQQYPLLTTVGGTGNYLDKMAPAQFYTQSDIQEIVAYAKQRNITVIPEIDMPGHATAANRAYPEFSGGGSPQHPEFTFNPGLEKTYGYLTNILRETDKLFPAKMIHIGGDEVSFGSEKWKTNPTIKQLMATNKLDSLKDVENYFIRRMADSLFKMSTKLLVWDEMVDANLPVDKTIIFWWRQERKDHLERALNKGFTTVLCPRLPLYFDFVQDSTHKYGRKWNKVYNALKDVYTFAPEKYGVTQAQSKQIIGIQANLWTETVPNAQRLEYLLFPRIAALAEAAWTKQENKDLSGFEQRLKPHLQLYQQAGIYYYNPFAPEQNPEPIVKKKQKQE